MVDYYSYIKSNAWHRKKAEYAYSGRSMRCYICDKPHDVTFHMHHKTYDRLGAELLDDIVPVCQECHTLIHKHQNSSKRTLLEATEDLRYLYHRSSKSKIKYIAGIIRNNGIYKKPDQKINNDKHKKIKKSKNKKVSKKIKGPKKWLLGQAKREIRASFYSSEIKNQLIRDLCHPYN